IIEMNKLDIGLRLGHELNARIDELDLGMNLMLEPVWIRPWFYKKWFGTNKENLRSNKI
ncbi:37720_t:CDS:2, partial [Gigaspora margarita]